METTFSFKRDARGSCPEQRWVWRSGDVAIRALSATIFAFSNLDVCKVRGDRQTWSVCEAIAIAILHRIPQNHSADVSLEPSCHCWVKPLFWRSCADVKPVTSLRRLKSAFRRSNRRSKDFSSLGWGLVSGFHEWGITATQGRGVPRLYFQQPDARRPFPESEFWMIRKSRRHVGSEFIGLHIFGCTWRTIPPSNWFVSYSHSYYNYDML